MNNLPDFSVQGYQAIRQLGLNAAGGRVVYLATDSKTQKQVAIKQFQFAKGAGWSEFKAIEQEIKVLQGLNHKGIPHHVGSFETDDGYCIVQEYKNAQPLSEPRSFDPDEVKQIAVSVLEILGYLQSFTSPIIHRDIKPENVVIDEQLNVYLIDFGLARIGGATTMSSMAAGTFGFMAPEQIYNKDLTEATDLYGLGATLIALLTGTKSTEMDTLFDEDSKIAFQERVPKLSLRFIEWLEKMVAPKLSDRYPNAETALAELQPLYVTRFPSVEFSQPELEFTARKPGEKLTQKIAIFNYTPETVLEGKWSVAPHPNDPPHSPDFHAWISFSTKEFKGNWAECQITVDTSKLTAQASGERSLILRTNSVPEIHELELNITTAPLPFAVTKLPYLMTANLLILAGLIGFLYAHFANAIELLLPATLFSLFFFILIYSTFNAWRNRSENIFMVLGDAFMAVIVVGSLVGTISLIPSIRILVESKFITITATAVIDLTLFANTLIAKESARKYLGLDKARRYTSGFLIFLMLITGAFGFSLGICINIVFLSNLYLLLATLVTGVLSVSLFFFAPLQRYRRISAYRQSEKNLIKP
jgi:serine/threonine protein kinase